MADRDAVIEILCDYPLKCEVKGLTRRVVNSTLDSLAASAAKVQPEIRPEASAEISAEDCSTLQPDSARPLPLVKSSWFRRLSGWANLRPPYATP